jgi:hypothetical protein
VPKAAVDEDCYSVRWKDKVGFAEHVVVTTPTANGCVAQELDEANLGGTIPAVSNAGHVKRTNRG